MTVPSNELGSDRDLLVLADLAAQLQETTVEDRVYALLARGIRQLIREEAIVSVSAFDLSVGTYSPRALLGLGPFMDKLVSILGKRPEDLLGDYTVGVKAAMTSGRLTRVDGGVAELARNALSPAVCAAIATLIGIEEVYVIGFRNGSSAGGVSIITRRPGLSLPTAGIEAMTTLCAIAIQRIRSQETLRESETRYRSIVQGSPVGYHIYSLELDGRLVFSMFNPAADAILHVNHERFMGLEILEAFPALAGTGIPGRYAAIARGELETQNFELPYDHGGIRGVYEVRAFRGAPGQAVINFVDVSEHKRADDVRRLNEQRLETLLELNRMTGASERELTHFALEAAVRTTGSSIGYLAFTNEDETLLTMYAWSSEAMRECAIRDKPIVYKVCETGLWGEAIRQRRAVITNDYTAPSPLKRGLPDGHVRLARHMNIPVFDGDRIVIVAGVGNKPAEYGDDDVRRLTLLMSGLWTIIRRRRAEDALRESEERYRLITENAGDVISVFDMDLRCTYASQSIARLQGFTPQEVVGQHLEALIPPESLVGLRRVFEEEMRLEVSGGADLARSRTLVFQLYRKDGSVIWVEDTLSFLRDKHGRASAILSVARDITERTLAQQQVEATLLFLGQNEKIARIGGFKTNPATDSLLWTEGVYRIIEAPLDYKPGLAEGIKYYAPEYRSTIADAVARTLESGEPFFVEAELVTNSGRRIWVEVRGLARVEADGEPAVVGTLQDITDRKLAEEERERLRAQLTQAQRMESVGRLAGGVAHDFNNMLGAILGYTELAMANLDPASPVTGDLEGIREAAERSADLTRQLLAFARRQTISPRVLDLNEKVGGMLKMLRRLIGEDMSLVWLPDRDIGMVRIDPSQVDQIMANLLVNARDAIAGTGKVTIETGGAFFDEAHCAEHVGLVPGEYVMLAVSDDGCGMDAETRGRLFEPFFTTKDTGKGTGLGLATVFGIVSQNDGFITVYSEPGQGTTFKIYLPRHRSGSSLPAPPAPSPAISGSEVILLVEDEPSIAQVTLRMLRMLGYRVLMATTPGEAMRLAREHAGTIDLVLTDVVMPEMNGRDLARNLLAIHPGIKRLFMSGYTANVIAHHGVLDEGVHFLHKPFSLEVLSVKLREVLEQD